MHQIFPSTFFNFEFVRILSTAPFGGADIAECLQAASEIKDGNPASWTAAWTKQAQKAESLAKSALISGDAFSARRAFMRASNYYRASNYMQHGIQSEGRQKVAALFQKGIKLLPEATATVHQIPYYGEHKLPAYLYAPSTENRLSGRKVPILINTGGADSIQEELYYIYGSTGPSLGYAVLTFEGPGQGTMLNEHGLHMRPDWEFVVGRVIDYLEQLDKDEPGLNLDLGQIAIAGASMGGYYALRGASDPRVKACVAIDPFYDMYDFATQHVSPVVIKGWQSGWISSALLNAVMGLASTFSFQTKWEVDLARRFFGVERATDTLVEMRKYTLKLDGNPAESFLKHVKCPVMVSGASKSLYLEPERDVKAIMEGLSHLADYEKRAWIAQAPEDGGLQAKVGALGLSAQRTFQFLDEHFDVERPRL